MADTVMHERCMKCMLGSSSSTAGAQQQSGTAPGASADTLVALPVLIRRRERSEQGPRRFLQGWKTTHQVLG
jgi:hypothetical protein